MSAQVQHRRDSPNAAMQEVNAPEDECIGERCCIIADNPLDGEVVQLTAGTECRRYNLRL
jgi:hypothetical protein